LTGALTAEKDVGCQIVAIFNNSELEGCIDDERQFKTAKRSQAPGDATVLKRFFRDNFVIFRRKSKRIAFLESVNFAMCKFSIFVMFT